MPCRLVPRRQTELSSCTAAPYAISQFWLHVFSAGGIEFIAQSPYCKHTALCRLFFHLYPTVSYRAFTLLLLLLLPLLHARPPQVHLIRSLRIAMTRKAVPVDIRQILLNLAEFMEHEVEVCAFVLSWDYLPRLCFVRTSSAIS